MRLWTLHAPIPEIEAWAGLNIFDFLSVYNTRFEMPFHLYIDIHI